MGVVEEAELIVAWEGLKQATNVKSVSKALVHYLVVGVVADFTYYFIKETIKDKIKS